MAKLTDKQQRFIEEYLVDFNATQAAIRAGYSENTANEQGSQNLAKLSIKEEIENRLNALSMQTGEITKRFTNLARGNMSDYLVERVTEFTPKVKVGLEELIQRLRDEIEFEDDFALQVDLKDKELEKHMKSQEARRRSVIRYKLELKRNPDAYRIVNGPTELVKEMVLDLVKIAEDKERGIIKSVKHTKDGVQVELYPADAALAQLAKIRGMLIDKSEVDLTATLDTVVKVGYGENQGD